LVKENEMTNGWEKVKNRLPTHERDFVLEWDGYVVLAHMLKPRSSEPMICIDWLGDKHILSPEEIQNRWWLEIPRIPRVEEGE
jgi:hypothetical protein